MKSSKLICSVVFAFSLLGYSGKSSGQIISNYFLSVSSSVNAGASLPVSFDIPIAGWGFIGIYNIGADNWAYLEAQYPADGTTSGTINFTAPAVAGTYQVRFISLFAEGAKVEAISTFSVGDEVLNTYSLWVSSSVNEGASLPVSFDIPIAGWGFIGIYNIGATDWAYLEAQHPAYGATSGTIYFTAPTVAGTYQVRFVSLFDGTKIEAVSNFSVGFATPVPPTPPLPPVTLPPNGGPRNVKATNVLNYLIDLPNHPDRRLITGQQIPSYDAQSAGVYTLWEIDEIYKQTGHYVGLMGVDGDSGSTDSVSVAIDYANKGGFVSLYPAFRNPISGESVFDTYIPDFNQLSTPGTPENDAFLSMLDSHTVPKLQQFKDAGVVVLFRPFPENNASWFWWGYREPAQFIRLWQQTYNYLTYTKGFDNLLWVYAASAGYSGILEYYPGTDYVDIVGYDSYSLPFDVAGYEALLTTGKPFILAEVNFSIMPDANTYNWSDMIEAIKTYLPRTVYFNVWYSYDYCRPHSYGLACQFPTTPTTFLDDPWLINRENLPSF